jgi:hypothetical protein
VLPSVDSTTVVPLVPVGLDAEEFDCLVMVDSLDDWIGAKAEGDACGDELCWATIFGVFVNDKPVELAAFSGAIFSGGEVLSEQVEEFEEPETRIRCKRNLKMIFRLCSTSCGST